MLIVGGWKMSLSQAFPCRHEPTKAWVGKVNQHVMHDGESERVQMCMMMHAVGFKQTEHTSRHPWIINLQKVTSAYYKYRQENNRNWRWMIYQMDQKWIGGCFSSNLSFERCILTDACWMLCSYLIFWLCHIETYIPVITQKY